VKSPSPPGGGIAVEASITARARGSVRIPAVFLPDEIGASCDTQHPSVRPYVRARETIKVLEVSIPPRR